ncbi:MAG: DUF6326 family protein [Chakrabartia sp.]
MTKQNKADFEDFRVPTRIKISALWASTMFCYVYGDYFGLFSPGTLMAMNAGIMGPLGKATPTIMLSVSLMMIIPSVMVFLSLILPATANRWINVVLGLAYSAIMLLTMMGAPLFYVFFGIVEVCLTLTIVWYSWSWPREKI